MIQFSSFKTTNKKIYPLPMRIFTTKKCTSSLIIFHSNRATKIFLFFIIFFIHILHLVDNEKCIKSRIYPSKQILRKFIEFQSLLNLTLFEFYFRLANVLVEVIDVVDYSLAKILVKCMHFFLDFLKIKSKKHTPTNQKWHKVK